MIRRKTEIIYKVANIMNCKIMHYRVLNPECNERSCSIVKIDSADKEKSRYFPSYIFRNMKGSGFE